MRYIPIDFVIFKFVKVPISLIKKDKFFSSSGVIAGAVVGGIVAVIVIVVVVLIIRQKYMSRSSTPSTKPPAVKVTLHTPSSGKSYASSSLCFFLYFSLPVSSLSLSLSVFPM